MKKNSRHRLLSTGAILSVAICSSVPAWAQNNSTTEKQSPTSTNDKGNSTAEEILEEIVVTGNQQRQRAGGLMVLQRQPETTNSITSDAIALKAGIAGPYQLVATLPGVNAGMSDPYQLSIRDNLFIRGLLNNKLGYVIDGVPVVDRAFFNPYINANVDNENMAGITVHPGAERIAEPVSSAVGGQFTVTVRDPSDEAGGQVSYSHGSFNGRRFFAGADTGEIGNSGVKAFLTGSYTEGGNWTSPDDAVGKKTHIDFKITKDWGGTATSSLWVSYNDWSVLRSQAYNLAQYNTGRQTGDYLTPNFKFTWDPTSNSNNWYKHAIYTRENLLISSKNEIDVSDALHLTVTPYYQWIRANSPAASSLDPANIYYGTQKQTVSTAGLFLQPNGRIPVKSNFLLHLDTYGVNSIATYEVSPTNSLQVSWWYDHYDMTLLNSFSPIASGGDAADWGGNPLRSTNGQVIASGDYNLGTRVNVLSVQDSQSFLDGRLKFEVGLRYFNYKVSGTNFLPGPQASGYTQTANWFQSWQTQNNGGARSVTTSALVQRNQPNRYGDCQTIGPILPIS